MSELMEPGWYWHNAKNPSLSSMFETGWQVVYVDGNAWVHWAGDEWGCEVSECEGEFIGPLSHPE